MKHSFVIEDASFLREIAGDPDFVNAELFKAEFNGHKFKSGETRTLTGLVDFPEFNGQKVRITALRVDGAHGKAYYIEGAINQFVNWVYEYRLA